MKVFLFSFTEGEWENEFPRCYQLVYADDLDSAWEKLRTYFYGQIYNIDCCTIM